VPFFSIPYFISRTELSPYVLPCYEDHNIYVVHAALVITQLCTTNCVKFLSLSFLYTRTFMHAHTHTHTNTHACTHTCTYAHMHAHTNAYTHHTHTRTHTGYVALKDFFPTMDIKPNPGCLNPLCCDAQRAAEARRNSPVSVVKAEDESATFPCARKTRHGSAVTK